MAVDVRDFTIPESNLSGLYKTADTEERRRERTDRLKLQNEARKRATSAFIENTYDPKDLFTGTIQDPNITAMMMDVKNKAYDLASQGVDPSMIGLALSPKVKSITDYSQKAKVLAEQKKQTGEFLKTQKGVDLTKFNSAFDDAAFKDEKGNVKDPSLIDPNQNYADLVLKTKPVFNNEGIQDFVANSGKDTRINRIQRVNSKGGSYFTDAELTAPNYMIPEKDNKGRTVGFEPKYDLATSEGEKIIHDFDGGTGHVKMVTDDVFKSLKPNAMAYILQEARRMASEHGKSPSDPEVENFAKAIAYDELKNAAKNSSSIKDIVKEKDNPAPRISIKVGGNNSSDLNIRDVYKEISDKGTGHKDGYVPLVDLSTGAQGIILKQARDLSSDDTISQKDIYVSKYPDGRLIIKKVTTPDRVSPNDPILGEMDFGSTNLPAQPSVKEKREVIKEGNKKITKEKISW